YRGGSSLCSPYEILAPLTRIMTSGIQDREGGRNVGNGANSSRPATRFARPRLPPGPAPGPLAPSYPLVQLRASATAPKAALRHQAPCRPAWPMGGPPAEGFPSLATAAPAFPGRQATKPGSLGKRGEGGAKWEGGARSGREVAEARAAASGLRRGRGL